MSIRDLEGRIKREKLPLLEKERMEKENFFTQEILRFENKVQADGMRLQETVNTELNILKEELRNEEVKRREYDSNLL